MIEPPQPGVETFLVEPADYADREQWNRALEEKIASYTPDYVVFAGFMRIVDAQLVARFENRIINTHPALLPSFPGAHGVRDALAHGVKITGLTVHFVEFRGRYRHDYRPGRGARRGR